MAKQYVLADQMYASNFDASSFISHQYIIAGQAESSVNFPYGAWGCPGGSGDMIGEVGPQRQVPTATKSACWDPTRRSGDELDTAGLSWAFYAVSYSRLSLDLERLSGNQYIYYGHDWKKDVITRRPSSSTTFRTESCGSQLGHADLDELRPCRFGLDDAARNG